jgi:MOSC domain-containing protein YiiM
VSSAWPRVAAVSRAPEHRFSKTPVPRIRLVAGFGADGDAHGGATVQHRSRVARDPSQPNLRQIHLIHEELFAELARQGFVVRAGDLGENITTRSIDLLALPRATRLHIGPAAVVEITGLRNPCSQLDAFQTGLMAAVLSRDANGALIRKAGVMSIVLAGGEVAAGDTIAIELPPKPFAALDRV